jgi:phage protein D
VPQIVERQLAIVLQFLDALADALVRLQQRAAQHAHLHLEVVRRQAIQRGGASVPASRFLASGILEICACTCVTLRGFGNGINHHALTTRKTTKATSKQSNSETKDVASGL